MPYLALQRYISCCILGSQRSICISNRLCIYIDTAHSQYNRQNNLYSNITFHNYAIKSKCPYFIVVTLLRPTTCQVALAVLHALANRVDNVPQTIDWLYLQGIFHQKFIFSCSQNYANGWIIVRLTYFCFEIVQVEVHLPNVTMLYLCSLQVNQHIAFQNTVVEHQIHLELSASYLHGVLSAHKCKATSHFQKELLHVVFQSLFQVTLLIAFLFGKSCKFKHERVTDDVLRSLYLMPSLAKARTPALSVLSASR